MRRKALYCLLLWLLSTVSISSTRIAAAQDQDDQGGITSLAWSPDGSKLAISYQVGYFEIMDMLSQQIVFSQFVGDVDNLMWNPQGTLIAFRVNYLAVDIFDVLRKQI